MQYLENGIGGEDNFIYRSGKHKCNACLSDLLIEVLRLSFIFPAPVDDK